MLPVTYIDFLGIVMQRNKFDVVVCAVFVEPAVKEVGIDPLLMESMRFGKLGTAQTVKFSHSSHRICMISTGENGRMLAYLPPALNVHVFEWELHS
jgi:hypothetical protein